MSILATMTAVDRAVFLALNGKIEIPSAPGTYYDVAGHQPKKKLLARLDEQIPLIWIKRKGGPSQGDVGSTTQKVYKVATTDVNDNPATYHEISSGDIVDLTYEVRYIAFHEDDERAMTAGLSRAFPTHGISHEGPGGEGPFWFDLALATDVPGLREDEIGGLYRIIARNVCTVEEPETPVVIPAITEVNVEFCAVSAKELDELNQQGDEE